MLANRYFYPRNLIQLTLEILAASSIYGVGLLWAYRTNRAFHVAEIAGLTTGFLPSRRRRPWFQWNIRMSSKGIENQVKSRNRLHTRPPDETCFA